MTFIRWWALRFFFDPKRFHFSFSLQNNENDLCLRLNNNTHKVCCSLPLLTRAPGTSTRTRCAVKVVWW